MDWLPMIPSYTGGLRSTTFKQAEPFLTLINA
jgi:hypothetical protein